jgi:hypothetical protein
VNRSAADAACVQDKVKFVRRREIGALPAAKVFA